MLHNISYELANRLVFYDTVTYIFLITVNSNILAQLLFSQQKARSNLYDKI